MCIITAKRQRLPHPMFMRCHGGQSVGESTAKGLDSRFTVSTPKREKIDLMASKLHYNKRLWQKHVLAENRRDIPGLLATLVDEPLYVLMATGQEYRGQSDRKSV